ncbi:hypothetical protein GCM10010412_098290 [Nonomuraea recticatena]|uniref:Transposase n=1 Tax=Nonomuraea recticatena TaxID=46178 RepID=A0ABP6FYT0_9ACTN
MKSLVKQGWVLKIRVRVTKNQRAALIHILEDRHVKASKSTVYVAGNVATFSMADPIGWLEGQIAQYPRGEFPRASLLGVVRKLARSPAGHIMKPGRSGRQTSYPHGTGPAR